MQSQSDQPIAPIPTQTIQLDLNAKCEPVGKMKKVAASWVGKRSKLVENSNQDVGAGVLRDNYTPSSS
jgi:hypothetical protein